MFKSILLLSIMIVTLLLSSTLSGQVPVLQPGTTLTPSSPDTLSWRTRSEPTVNFWPGCGAVGDSVAVWFEPKGPCTLKAIRVFSYDYEGTCLADIWDGSHYDGHITATDSTDSNGWIGDFEDDQWVPGPVMGHTPLGWDDKDPARHLWGSFPFTMTSALLGDWLEIPARLGVQGEVYIEGPFFLIVTIYITAGYGWAAENEGTVPYNTFYYCAGDDYPGPGGQNGWYIHSASVWFEAIVEYVNPSTVQEQTDQNIPRDFCLFQNYPNPFNSTTDIRYQIADGKSLSQTTLKIFNLLGQEVKILVDEQKAAGYYTATWDGRDESGLAVASGIYFYRITTGSFSATKRMLLVK